MKLNFRGNRKAGSLPGPKKSWIREWADAVMFAVVFATIIRWATLEAFAIPSSSMENSLLTGDYLFVSKMHYGSRTPITPLQVPLTHQSIWGTQIQSYSDAVQLPFLRLPGFSKIKRYDPIVFNYPVEENRPIDLKTNYIKRCMGLAGDTLEIKMGKVFINGQFIHPPEELQFRYYVKTDRFLEDSYFRNQDISEFYPVTGGYLMNTLPNKAAYIQSLKFIKEVQLIQQLPKVPDPDIFPHNPTLYPWNLDNLGPLYIPKAGATIAITPQTLPLYEKVILTYEHQKNASVQDGKLFINGQETKQYTFKQNYYFMVGDNRHNSEDSRYWGFVPEDHIVGKAVLVWMSVDANASLYNKIRWNRLLQPID
ncbi:signal peptidase I [Adhaeribacter aquaticus]|uniref:signal peptidase I n=1 Tax=Adhaeribacter aquaticus TaxID=299567 RepID=UPI0003FB2A29|nr:signal peptidase I [Adhaeribacter aquaticus]